MFNLSVDTVETLTTDETECDLIYPHCSQQKLDLKEIKISLFFIVAQMTLLHQNLIVLLEYFGTNH